MNQHKSTTILIVEDDLALRETLADILSGYHHVIGSDNGAEALEILQNCKPDLLLLDVMLPFPLDGFSVLRVLKNDPVLSLIPVILMSGIKTEQTILEGLKMGANDYIVKPFRSAELLLKCNNLINMRLKIEQKVEREMFIKTPQVFQFDIESEFKQKFENITRAMVEGSDFTVPNIASKMLMSISTLERWTKKIYNMTPKQYIQHTKLTTAEIYLRQRLTSVNEIAYTLGFSSVSYFCLSFKKKYGKTPKAYMRFPAKAEPVIMHS